MQSMLKFVFAAGLVSAACVPAAFAAQSADFSTQAPSEQVGPIEAVARLAWRGDMAQIATPSEGCFHASYPSVIWKQVECKQVTPRAHPVPRRIVFGQQQTAGNGNDYTLNSASPISKAVGSFPTYSGVTSEKSVGVAAYGGGGILGANEYSLQMNTSFTQTSAACAGHSGCTVWQQFIYATDYSVNGQGTVFMQDWLIGWGTADACPSGFGSDGEGDCYENSAGTQLADISPKNLGGVTVTGTATTGGNDTTVVTYDGDAYSTSQKDSTLDIASVWNEVEYNVVGDAGGSEAKFNTSGVSVKVNIAATNGSSSAPTCQADNGTTGESNNLTLGSCTATSGSTPSISFTESN
ncbi:MAG: hypothetical protein WA777_18340 [Rhodanobacter sp.]